MAAASEEPASVKARRNPDSTFQVLCKHLAWHARTRDVNDKLERRLCALDSCVWRFERGFSIASVRVPFMLFGPVGVFLLQASGGFWSGRDIVDMRRAAETLALRLTAYPDPVHCGIVMLGEEVPPRQYFAGGGDGPCWMLGEDVLINWLHSFDDHGLSEGDIAFLRDWSSPARVREPGRPCTPVGEG